MEDNKKNLNCEDLNAVAGGEGSDFDYPVTNEKRCPYCNSIYVSKGQLKKNTGTAIWIEYRCLKCHKHFWVEA